jgi:integrase
MPRPIKSVPAYRHHKASGRAVVTLRNPDGSRRDFYLPGSFDSPESKQEYRRVLALLESNGAACLPSAHRLADITVSELTLQFMERKVALDYIDSAGKPTSEYRCFVRDLSPLVRLFGPFAAAELDAPKLEVVQGAMADGSWLTEPERAKRAKNKLPIGWCRKSVNKALCQVRALLKFGVRKKLIPAAVLAEAQVVEPLRVGRGKARETAPVVPVDPAIVDVTLPHLPPVVADMVRVQLATGMRPGELCAMRVANLENTSAEVWMYKPSQHKTAHLGHTRAIAIGPKAQLILKRYLKTELEA